MASCETKKRPLISDIYPLHPYEFVALHEDPYAGDKSVSILKYYIVYGDIDDKKHMESLLTTFSFTHVDSSKLNDSTIYDIIFYKQSKRLSKDYKESYNDKIDFHSEDKIAVYSWIGLKGDLRWRKR